MTFAAAFRLGLVAGCAVEWRRPRGDPMALLGGVSGVARIGLASADGAPLLLDGTGFELESTSARLDSTFLNSEGRSTE